MHERNNELKALTDGLVRLVYTADEAYLLHREIGVHADAINAQNLGRFFGFVQNALYKEFVLSITKVFERPNRRGQSKGIPALLAFIRESSAGLRIREPFQLYSLLDVVEGLSTNQLRTSTDQEMTGRLLNAFESRLPSIQNVGTCELSAALYALRSHRDKRIAHTDEAVGDLPGATWDQCNKLLAYAKHLLGAIGWAYLSTVYTIVDGGAIRWTMETDAQMTRSALWRLLEMAGLRPEDDE